jgi:hypothetical protein
MAGLTHWKKWMVDQKGGIVRGFKKCMFSTQAAPFLNILTFSGGF